MRGGSAVVWALVASGCGGGGCGGGAGGATTNLELSDENNYTQVSSITFGHYEVQQQPSELTIDWTDFTEDIRGRPVVPGDLDQVYFSELTMTEEELVQRVLSNDIAQSDATSATWGNDQHVTTMVASDFDLLGNPLDLTELLPAAGTSWVVSLVEIPEGTSENQVLTTVLIDFVESGPETLTIGNGASSVTVTPDLHTSPALLAEANADSYTLDWSAMEQDVFGLAFDNLVANTLVILNYPGTVSDVESDFLLVDYNATAVYKLDVYGELSARLEDAVDADGNTFPGFTAEGTWLVGLVDNQSLSPLPLVMAVVEVE